MPPAGAVLTAPYCPLGRRPLDAYYYLVSEGAQRPNDPAGGTYIKAERPNEVRERYYITRARTRGSFLGLFVGPCLRQGSLINELWYMIDGFNEI